MHSRLLTSSLTLALISSFAAGCAEDSPTAPGNDASVPQSRVTAQIIQVSSQHDCDPNQDNPGDFEAWIEFTWYDRWNGASTEPSGRVTSPRKSFTLNTKDDAASFSAFTNNVIEMVPRKDRAAFQAILFVRESDSGSTDEQLTALAFYQYDADVGCWINGSRNTCGGAGFSAARTFREDEFHLFNGDDEGCHMAISGAIRISE